MNNKTYERFDIEAFERTAVPALEFNEVTQELIKEEQNRLINESQLRRNRDWSCLAGQVFGAEVNLQYQE